MIKKSLIAIVMFIMVLSVVSANPMVTAPAANTMITVAENATAILSITHTAPDNGSAVSPSLNLSNSWISSPSFTTTQTNYTFSPGFSDEGVYTVNFSVADVNSTDSRTFRINVTNTNRAPTTNFTDVSVTQGVSKTYDLAQWSNDADGDSRTYSVSSADTSKITCSVASTTLTVLASASFAGTSNCNLTVGDGSLLVNKEFVVTSVAKNPSLSLSIPSSLTLLRFDAGDTLSFNLNMTENGNMPLSDIDFTITNLVKGTDSITLTSTSLLNNQLTEDQTKSIGFTATLLANSALAYGTYVANVTASYEGKTTIGTITVTLRAPNYALTVGSTLDLGSTTQARNTTTSAVSFVLTNAGDYQLNSFTVTPSASSEYQLQVSVDNVNFVDSVTFSSLAAGGTKTIYTKAFVPVKQTSKKTSIGSISITSDNKNVSIGNVYMTAVNKLEIRDVEVTVDGDDQNVNNGGTFDEVLPGSKVVFKVEGKNLFSSTEEIQIENIDVKVTIKDIDDEGDDDLDEKASLKDLDDGDDDDVSLTFNIPLDVDHNKKYEVLIELEGEDENNVDHYDSWTIYLQVEKESHDIQIMEARLGSDELQCIRSTTLTTRIKNLGEDQEEDVRFEITSTDLDISYKTTIDELEEGMGEDTEYDKSLSIDVPDSLKAGTYKINVKAFYDNDKTADQKILTLLVKDCSLSTSTTTNTGSTDSSNVVVTTGTDSSSIPVIPTSGTVVSATTDNTNSNDGFSSSGLYVTLLVALNVAVIGGIIYLLFAFLL